jgi:hypothetical protein
MAACTQLLFDQTTKWEGSCPVFSHPMYCTICCYSRCVPNTEGAGAKCYFHTAQLLVPAPSTMLKEAGSACRKDPLFKLSDGSEFTVEIGALIDREDIAHVVYELHLPHKVKITDTIVYPGEKCIVHSASDNNVPGFVLVCSVIAAEGVLVQVTVIRDGIKYKVHGQTNEEIYIALEL